MRDAVAAGVAPSANGQARCERKGNRGVSSGRTSTMVPLVLLLVVSTGWGSALSLARFAVTAGVPPMGYVLWMSVAAAVLCLGLARARGGWPKFSSAHIVYYVSSGCTRFVFAGFVMYTVLGHLPAGVVAIVIATAPLMTYLVRSALRRVRPDGKRGCGIVLGFVGVALLFVPRQALPDPSAIGWLALGFLTPLLYTVSNLAIERLRPPGEDSMALTSGMFVTAIVFSLPLAITIGQFHPIWETGIALREGAMFTHAAILAFCFFGLYELFRLLDATFGSQVTYLTTVSGVVYGIVLLGERPSLWVWAAVACIVAGMALVGRDATPSPK